MKGGLLDYITNHAHFYQFRYRQLLSRLSSRWPELDRDDEMMMKCWDASGKLPLEALRLFPQRKNKQIHELNDVTFRKSAAATQQQKKYNNTTQWILLLLWREIWMKTGRAAEKQKQRLHKRAQTAVFSSSDEHTATGETDYLCVIQLGIIHVRCDLSKEKALSISSLTFSSCHGAKTPSAVKPVRNAAAQLIAQLSLSLSLSIASALYLSPTVYLPVLLQQWLLCFALHPSTLLPIPPTISLTPLPSLPPVTAPQQSNAAPSASIALISRSHTSQVWRQDETEFGNFVVFMIKASCTCRLFPLAVKVLKLFQASSQQDGCQIIVKSNKLNWMTFPSSCMLCKTLR